jgi:hypothetical protein
VHQTTHKQSVKQLKKWQKKIEDDNLIKDEYPSQAWW